MHLGNLQVNWEAAIDIEGLNQVDKLRIREIGFDKWLEEIGTKPLKQSPRTRG